MKKNAFTLMELMIVVIIITILAGASILYGSRPLEFARARGAREMLLAIHTAERQYCISTGAYGDRDALLNEGYLENPNDLDQTYWSFSITAGGSSGPNECGTYDARATRTGGPNNGEHISIDESGQIDMNSWDP